MIPLPSAEQVKAELRPYLPFFRAVPRDAWVKALAEGPSWADRTSLKNLAWNAMSMLGKERAASFGLEIVVLRNGRPLPCYLARTTTREYLVRLNNLTDDLKAGGWHTGQRGLWEEPEPYQPTFPGLEPPLHLRGGYVLDPLQIAVARTPLLLSQDDAPVWAFDIDDEPESGTGGGGDNVIPIRPMPDSGKDGAVVPMRSTKIRPDEKKDEPEQGS